MVEGARLGALLVPLQWIVAVAAQGSYQIAGNAEIGMQGEVAAVVAAAVVDR